MLANTDQVTRTRPIAARPPKGTPADLAMALINARVRSVESQIKTLQAELRELGQIRKQLQEEEN